MTSLSDRVAAAASAALEESSEASLIEVMGRIGWLPGNSVDRWEQGRFGCLEDAFEVSPAKLVQAREIFKAWVESKGLIPSEALYVTTTRDRRPLRFTPDGDEVVERFYRTHWISPDLPEARRSRLTAKQTKPPDLVVILPIKDWTCSSCGSGDGDFLIMEGAGPLCLSCADMAHLVFLPRGDAALTRRAKKESRLSAVVVQWSRNRKRYERQGLLVEEPALERAESQCLADEDVRASRRDRDRERRALEDVTYLAELAAEIVRLFPGCPAARASEIARHTGSRGSGRVGRSAAGRALREEAVTLAVAAAVRHEDTEYDTLLMSGISREDARARVRPEIDEILTRWRT